MIVVVLLLALVVVALRVLNSGSDSDAPQSITVPLGGRQAATVTIDAGADNITVTTADLGGNLAVISTPDGVKAGVAPQAEVNGATLRVWTKEIGELQAGAAAGLDIQVAKGVRWDVSVAKGARQIKLALGDGSVSSVELNGGADNADVTLPEPKGELVAKIPTGLAAANFHLRTGVPTQVKFGNGAGNSSIDGVNKVGLRPGQTLYGKGTSRRSYAAAKDKVLIDVSAGVGTVSVDHS